jgi:hypothetical protein
LIARRHGGEFQRDWVERSIDGRQKIASHGAYTMPVWGEDFSQIGDPDAERATRTMIARLVDYAKRWALRLRVGALCVVSVVTEEKSCTAEYWCRLMAAKLRRPDSRKQSNLLSPETPGCALYMS